MKKTQLLLITVMIVHAAHSQAQVRILKDNVDGSPVSFATIKVLHKPQGVVAGEDGKYVLEVAPTDTVLLTRVGYLTKKVLGKELPEVLQMEPDRKAMDTVVTRGTAFICTVVVGNGLPFLDRKLECNVSSTDLLQNTDCIPWGPANVKEEFAERILLPDSNKVYRIRKIYIPTRKSKWYGPLIVRIYKTDEVTGLPGELIFQKYVQVGKKSVINNKVVLDLSTDGIRLSQSAGFFVSLGWPPGVSIEKGLTILGLYKLHSNNSFTRKLDAVDFSWLKLSVFSSTTTGFNTAYAVEMEERVYRQ